MRYSELMVLNVTRSFTGYIMHLLKAKKSLYEKKLHLV